MKNLVFTTEMNKVFNVMLSKKVNRYYVDTNVAAYAKDMNISLNKDQLEAIANRYKSNKEAIEFSQNTNF